MFSRVKTDETANKEVKEAEQENSLFKNNCFVFAFSALVDESESVW